MSTCVVIEVDDDGAVRVGVLPPEAIAQYADALQPAQSVEDALSTAKDLLTNPQIREAVGGPTPQQLGKSQDQMWDRTGRDFAKANG